MKGTVPRPRGPAPAANTATHATPARDQNRGLSPSADAAALTEPPIDPSNRITLAILEESSVARAKGYDPYNKSAPRQDPADVWYRKRKRD